MGSWKIIAIDLPRSLRTVSAGAEMVSTGPVGRFNMACPEILVRLRLCNPITAREVTDFPEPDSPTTANVSPRETEKVMSSEALTTPSSVGKETNRFFTSRNGFTQHAPLDRDRHTERRR